MIKKFETKQYLEVLYCDKCGKEMESDNFVYATFPPTYKYNCECGNTCTNSKLYPQIITERIKEIGEEV